MLYFHKTPSFFFRVFPKQTWHLDRLEKNIFLTFDDGPTSFQDEIVSILESYKIKATFFLVGENVEKNPQRLEDLLDRKYPVGNHTFNHLNGWRVPANTYLENIRKCDEILEKYGARTKLFRPPYGKIMPNVNRKLLKAGYQTVMWDVLSGDFDSKLDSTKALNQLSKVTSNGSIIVFHDSEKFKKKTLEILPPFIEMMLDRNQNFRGLEGGS